MYIFHSSRKNHPFHNLHLQNLLNLGAQEKENKIVQQKYLSAVAILPLKVSTEESVFVTLSFFTRKT